MKRVKKFGVIFVLNKSEEQSEKSGFYSYRCLIAASSILGGYYSAPNFLQFKEFELYWGAVFFLRSVHTFSWFLKSNWSSDFGHAETGNGAKKRVVLRREIFRSNFKVEWEYGVWTKIRFIGSGFLFTCGNFTLIFTVFSIFGSDFFLNGFSNPFIVRSRSSFLFSQWKFFELYVRTCPTIFFYFV